MKIGGMGTEVIRIPFEDIRLLAELPADVEVVAALASPLRGQPYGPGWTHDPTFYLQIRHRYCARVSDGEPLMYDYLQRFLKRYAEIKADEESKRGIRVEDALPEGYCSSWVDDDA